MRGLRSLAAMCISAPACAFLRRFSTRVKPGPNPRNLPIPTRRTKAALLTRQERYALSQRRKHAPRIPAARRLDKRILVLDRPEDIPREMEKLKNAMYAGKGTVTTSVMGDHWRSLLFFAHEDLFGHRARKRKPPSPGRRKTIAHIGMPLDRSKALVNPERLQQMMEIFAFIDKHFHLTCTCYTTMMNTFERIGEPAKALALYNKMISEGVEPDLFCFNSLIKVHGAMGSSAEAVKVLDAMVTRHVKPDIVTYTNLIHIFSAENDHDAMLSVYDLINKNELLPTVVTVAALVDGLCKARRLREAVVIFQESRERGIKMNDFAFNAMVSGVSRKGDVRLARKYLQTMAEEGIKPNMQTFKAMLNAIVVAGQYGDALNLHAAVSEHKFGDVVPCGKYYDALLNALGNSFSPNYAAGLQIFKEAVNDGHFQKVWSLGRDRYLLTSVSIGTVPFVVQSVLHSYIDRTYSEDPATPNKRIRLEGVAPSGLMFICGPPKPREATSQVQLKRPTKRLQFHMAQETNMVHLRVEEALQFLQIPYEVFEAEALVRVIIEHRVLRHWVMGYHRICMKKPAPDGGTEQVFYVYKPGIRVSMPPRKYGQAALTSEPALADETQVDELPQKAMWAR